MISRLLSDRLRQAEHDKKVLIILGPRQTGKTTLLRELYSDSETVWLDGDSADTKAILDNATVVSLSQLLTKKKRLIIDEAQNIRDIGRMLKQIHDHIPHMELIATGSSSFELSSQINEPLTGRKWEYFLYPVSTEEMILHHGALTEARLLEQRMIYGFYPEILMHPDDAQRRLVALSDSYLYKDVLKWQNVKKPVELEKLIQALAWQISKEVSYNELAQMTGLTNETVQRYIDLLEKSFVVFSLPSFSRNLRNEIRKGRKIYFYDLGIRNAVIKQFQPLALRNDVGALWENFLVVERMKYKSYHDVFSNDFFWRTHAQQEIDFIEDRNGIIHAYEFKWSPKKKHKVNLTFATAYPNHTFKIISRENYFEFVNSDGFDE